MADLPDELAALDAELTAKAAAASEGPEPCFGCECCGLWVQSLELLRSSIRAHVAGEIRAAPCSSGCLVCAEVGWQGA